MKSTGCCSVRPDCCFGEDCGRILEKPPVFSKLDEQLCGNFKNNSIGGNADNGFLACGVLWYYKSLSESISIICSFELKIHGYR